MDINFAQLQADMIAGDLSVLEAERKSFTKKFWKHFLICLALFIGIPLAVFIVNPDSMFVALIAAGLILVGSAIFLGTSYSRFYKYFKEQFKGKVIPTVVKFVDERLHYEPNKELIDKYTESRIFSQRYDRYKAEDTISGKFDLTDFAFGEIHTEYKTVTRDKNGNRQEHWHTIFKGMLFVSDFHKNFNGETIIDVDYMERFFGRIGRRFQKWNPSRTGNLVKLENPEFENKFAVYSTDEQECRYILTPSMMERLVEMGNKIHFKVAISFRNNQVYIAVFNNMDLFEPSVFGSLLKEEDYRIIITMMKLMTGIIEDLNLNTRIWMKE
ncbi:DUF3137 domain-containing protein [Fluviicola taffensis]|uniref:Galanin n=1 Tax=Fluviicola taffensis (strain DSM 16823 / NCIMB 13979 / RW262) TaxID=755732 RepID=F2IJD3_FLUTR|nr:DUF3137 domain-containing protein [Fluviicola taffensis]AEA46030.1 galanin [Fluviicola taffensis DSM 16823]